MDGLAANMIVAGIFATIVMDIWQRLLHAAAGIPPTHWGMIGRWFGHLPRGRVMHDSIATAAPIAGELPLGWFMHYLVGVGYGVIYVGMMLWLFDGPTLLNGFVFGLVSVVIPWFMMQPCMGLGVLGAKAPNPNIPRYSALAVHCLYGVSLYAGSALHSALTG